MKFADLLKQSTASTSAAVITLGTGVSGFRTLAQAIADGELSAGDQSTFMVRDAAGKYEFSLFTVTSATTLTRVEVRRSSNNGAAETFGAGVVVANIPDAEWLSQLLGTADGVELSSLPIVSSLISGDQALILRAGAAYLAPTSLLAGGTGAPADTTAPTAPTSLASSSVTQTSFTVSFTAGTDNVGVQRHEWSLDGTSWTQIASGTTFNVTGRTAGTTYTVRVRTVDTSGNVSTAATLSVTTSAAAGGDTTAPTMSGSITTSNITSSGYTFSYSAGTDNVGIDHYETSIDGGATWVSNGASLSRTVTGRPASTTDNLRVRAHDAAGNISNVLTATVTTSAATGPVYVLSSFTKGDGTAFPTTGTMTSAGSESYADTSILIKIKTAANAVPPNDAIKFVWGKSATVCPVADYSATVVPTNSGNGNTSTRTNAVGGGAKAGSWSTSADAAFGTYRNAATFYAWGTPGDWYLWVLTSDGFIGVAKDAQGNPAKWTLS